MFEKNPLERCFSLPEAQSSALALLTSLNFSHNLSVVGSTVCAAKCDLFDINGRIVSSGLGKGTSESATVGAIFEALEHYFTSRLFIKDDKIEYVASDTLVGKEHSILSEAVSSTLRQNPNQKIACIPHQALSDSDHSELYPIGLFMPKYVDQKYNTPSKFTLDNFDYGRLGEYSSNSGVAIGMNRLEAVLHGLLEALERDAISRFLFNTFIKRDASLIRKINNNTLPKHIIALIESIAVECSVEEISIYEMPNRFNIPAFCAWMDKPSFGIYQPGFGCSVSRDHAVERSLYELAQADLSFTRIHDAKSIEKLQISKLENLENYTALERCMKCNIIEIEEDFGFSEVNYQSSITSGRKDANAYLKRALEIIQGTQNTAFTAKICIPVETDIEIMHTFVSNSDRFMTVLGGRVPMPIMDYS